MMIRKKNARRRPVLVIASVVLMVATAACSNSSGGGTGGDGGGGGTSAAGQPPTANEAVPSSIGQGEGQLNLIAWEGYTQPLWVKPFEDQTGCTVSAKYAGSSNQMVALMSNGGGGQYDMVSASGDASLRLIYGGDVRPVNVDLIPDWKNFIPQMQSPSHNTIDGVHYGVSLQWGPNTLMYNPADFPTAPDSWSVLYDSKYSGKITVPDNPIQIADAALYLKATQPDLGIDDVFELTQPQFDAAINLLKQQRPLIKKYWALASQEISMFKNGDAIVGASWPYQESVLQSDGVNVASVIPKEGATGWADTWMMATNAPHPNCAYEWMKYISTPKAQALQATWYGETPANKLACPLMDKIDKGSCSLYHADAPASYFDSIAFWKTPTATCADGSQECVPYQEWQTAWTTEVTG